MNATYLLRKYIVSETRLSRVLRGTQIRRSGKALTKNTWCEKNVADLKYLEDVWDHRDFNHIVLCRRRELQFSENWTDDKFKTRQKTLVLRCQSQQKQHNNQFRLQYQYWSQKHNILIINIIFCSQTQQPSLKSISCLSQRSIRIVFYNRSQPEVNLGLT